MVAISGTNTRNLYLRIHTDADGSGFVQTEHDLDRLDRKVDQTSHRFQGFSGDTRRLADDMRRAREEVRQFGLAWSRTNSQVDHDLYRSAKRRLSGLERLAKDILPGDENRSMLAHVMGRTAGGGGWGGTGIDFSQGLAESRGIIIAGLVGLAIAASPAIGAVVAGAVTGAVGLGGIAGGVVAAASDPRVKDAWEGFVESFSADDFGRQAFVKPTIAALDELKSAFRDMDLGDALEKMAPFVEVLAEGIGDLGRNFMPGFNETLDRAGPLVEVFSQGLGETGAALGDMISDMASSEGTIEGLVMLFDLVSGTLRFVGEASRELADIWDFLTDVGQTLADSVANVSNYLSDELSIIPGLGAVWNHLGNVARNMEGHWRDMNQAQEENTATSDGVIRRWRFLTGASDGLTMSLARQRDELQKLGAAYDNYYGIQMSVDQANQRVNESWLAMRESLDENGDHWETNTRAGLNNRAMLLALVASLNQKREADLKAAGDSVQAQQAVNKAYENGLKDVMALAAAHGLVGQALKDLVGDYQVNIYFQGLVDQATAVMLAFLGRYAGAFSFAGISHMGGGSKKSGGGGGGSSTSYNWPGGVPPSSNNPPSPWGGSTGYPGYAAGGLAPAGMPIMFGEHSPTGPKMTMFRRPTYIMPDGGPAGGGGNITATVVGGGGGRWEDLIVEVLTRHVQFSYGGNIAKMTERTAR